jgi:hypothetical protein
VFSFLDNKPDELTKRLPKHYELVRIGLERECLRGVGGLFGNSNG